MILTNKFHVEIDFDRVDQDYDVFLVRKTKDLYKTNILDLATEQFQARAVQYFSGIKALVLFDKSSISEQEFKTSIMTDYPDVTVTKLDILNEEVRRNNFYYQSRLLLQLLVNSIRVPRIEGFSYNNLTGRLFYGDPHWVSRDKRTKKPYSMYFLEISFDAGVYLNLEVKTFRKRQYSKNGRYYLIDPKNGNFRRKLKEDIVAQEDLYVEESFAGSRNTVTYLDFSSFEAFRKCKIGVMEHFLQDVKKYLCEYLTLTAEQRDNDYCYKESKKEKDNLSGVDCSFVLNELGVNIVDECRTEESGNIIGCLVTELQHFYGITAQIGELEKSMYNIRLIHSPEYYEDNNLPDPHADDLHGLIVQHMTVEEHRSLVGNLGLKKSPVIHKILTELILKGDVHYEQIRIYNWEKLRSDKTWTFVRRDKLDPPEGGRFDMVENSVGKKTWERFTYITVQIDKEGKMQFRSFDDTELSADRFEERIRYAFDYFVSKQKPKQKEVEGLVFSDIDNIHAIIRTCEKTMPNAEAIWNGLKLTNGKDAVSVDIVIEALKAFVDIYPDYSEFSERLINSLQDGPAAVTKKEMRNLLNMKTKAGKIFNRFLHELYSIWISLEIKDSDFSNEFMLENVTDIKYFEDSDTDGEGIISLNYYAGMSRTSLQQSVNNASIVRQVQAEEEVEFKELLPLMAVDFVRIGQYTVLPFPFKYLREYKDSM